MLVDPVTVATNVTVPPVDRKAVRGATATNGADVTVTTATSLFVEFGVAGGDHMVGARDRERCRRRSRRRAGTCSLFPGTVSRWTLSPWRQTSPCRPSRGRAGPGRHRHRDQRRGLREKSRSPLGFRAAHAGSGGDDATTWKLRCGGRRASSFCSHRPPLPLPPTPSMRPRRAGHRGGEAGRLSRQEPCTNHRHRHTTSRLSVVVPPQAAARDGYRASSGQHHGRILVASDSFPAPEPLRLGVTPLCPNPGTPTSRFDSTISECLKHLSGSRSVTSPLRGGNSSCSRCRC